MAKKDCKEMKDYLKYLNKRGFGLLEAMVAVGILGVATLGGLQVAELGSESIRDIETDRSIGQSIDFIRYRFRDVNYCNTFFTTANLGENGNIPANVVTAHLNLANNGIISQIEGNKIRLSTITNGPVDPVQKVVPTV